MPFIREKSCGVIVFRERNKHREFLLLHYPGGHWDFPKGHVEKGEKELETAARELKEETGISNVEFLENFREPVHYYYQRKKTLFSKDVIFYLAKTLSKRVKISFEHKNFLWLPYEKAYEKLTFKNARDILARGEMFLVRTAELIHRKRARTKKTKKISILNHFLL